jgi:Flp pilus assembly protein TadD
VRRRTVISAAPDVTVTAKPLQSPRLNQAEAALALGDRQTAARVFADVVDDAVKAGNVWLEMGDGPRAVSAFTRLVQAAPREAEFVRLLGQALRMTGDYEAALARFEVARQIDPTQDRAWID